MAEERRLGSRYVLEEQIGRGATGRVWRGRDDQGTRYAIKVLKDDLASDPAVVQRFVQERSILTGVDHPGLVRVHDLVVEGETLAIVLDLVEGGDLRSMLTRRGPLPPAEVAAVGAHVATALGALHRTGIAHRDVKPENVLIEPDGQSYRTRVTDFGIAKFTEAAGTASSTAFVGTPQYIAPEIIDGAPPTPAVDVYALGILLYELSVGVTPYAGAPTLTTLKLHAEATPGRPEGIPDALWSIIIRAVDKQPTARPAAEGLAHELGALFPQLQGIPAAPAIASPPPPVASLHHQETSLSGAGATAFAAGGTGGFGTGGHGTGGFGTGGQGTGGQGTGGQVASAAVEPEEKPKRRKGLIVAAALAAVLVLGGGAVAAMNLFGGDDTDGPTTALEDPTDLEPAEEPTEEESEEPTTEEPTTEEPTTEEPTTPEPEPIVMPGLLDLSLAQAERQVPDGVTLVTEEIFEEGVTSPTVTGQTPDEGTELAEGDTVTLQVTRPYAMVYLYTLSDIGDRGWREATAQLSGNDYPNSMATKAYVGGSSSSSWNLSRGYRLLRATVGLDDRTTVPGARVRIEVFADRVKVDEVTVEFGEYPELEVDLTDVLRLEITYTVLEGARTSTDPQATLGDVRLLGHPDEMPDEDAG